MDIEFDVNGKPVSGYLAVPYQSNRTGVIVLHAWWGLNSFFKEFCDRLAAKGFFAFAPDLNEGRVATTVEEAKEIMSSLDSQRKYDVAMAAVDFMRVRPDVGKGPLSLIGFSMGGAWSLVLAEERPEDIHKVVLFYGAGEGDYTKMKTEIMGHFSDTDEWEDIDYVRSMENDMRSAGLKTNFYIYPQLPHWFFEPDRPEFNPEAAELAWQRTLEFLNK
jgi:carboxymethylenebutenolidase